MYLILFASSWWANPGNWISMGKAALGLGLVIFVHELGHFLVAKACGVKCEKFYVGFDVPLKLGPIQFPSALFRRQWGETEYGVGIIPLGGYVKMLGQDDNPANAAEEAERIRNTGGALDPRSYPAKSVPQRMAIISAGVVMNLIFAVIFAMVAYRMGVSYIPCVVGRITAGDPAWSKGIEPGTRIVQIGRKGEPNEHLRFIKDLKVSMFLNGKDQDVDLQIEDPTNKERQWVTMRPSSRMKAQAGTPTIGITSASSLKLIGLLSELPSDATEPPPARGNLVAIEVADQIHKIENPVQVDPLLAQYPDQTLKLHVRAVENAESPGTSSQQNDVIQAPPQPLRRLGLVMTMGPIQAIQEGSPAIAAGLKMGDVIQKIDGRPVGDPISLGDRIRRLAGQEVVLTVNRPSQPAPIEIHVTPRQPTLVTMPKGDGSLLSLEAIGVAFNVGHQVADVVPNSPAAKNELAAGDQIVEVQFVPDQQDQRFQRLLRHWKLDQPVALSQQQYNWPWFFANLQLLPPDATVILKYDREGSLQNTQLQAVDWVGPFNPDQIFNPEHGLLLESAEEIHQATSWGEALGLGVRETKEGVLQVVTVLRRFKDAFRNLGGPGSIAVLATSEASAGLPRLLVFLTLLSANLAVLNFLPIPVLDGGHMMFLLYEGVMGKPVNERVAMSLTLAGLAFILGLMAFVIGLDITRFVG